MYAHSIFFLQSAVGRCVSLNYHLASRNPKSAHFGVIFRKQQSKTLQNSARVQNNICKIKKCIWHNVNIHFIATCILQSNNDYRPWKRLNWQVITETRCMALIVAATPPHDCSTLLIRWPSAEQHSALSMIRGKRKGVCRSIY